MTCRDELLLVIAELVAHRPDRTFWVAEVIEGMQARGAAYSATTIRGTLSQSMCLDTGVHREPADVERLSRGRYRLVRGISAPSGAR